MTASTPAQFQLSFTTRVDSVVAAKTFFPEGAPAAISIAVALVLLSSLYGMVPLQVRPLEILTCIMECL